MPSNSAVRAAYPALRPLVCALSVALACATHGAHAGLAASVPRQPQTIVVGNCDDDGDGSLRRAVDDAVDGDTIDLTQLSCASISLDSGAIVIGSDDLKLQGPGHHGLLVHGVGDSGSAVLYDLGGSLTLDGIDIAFGSKYRSDVDSRGGCVYAIGDLSVSDSHIYACSVRSNDPYVALGGALAAQGDVTLSGTAIDLCGATAGDAPARGGGVFAGGDLVMISSSISGCRIAAGGHGYGGGAYVAGDLLMKYSTIDGNTNNEATTGDGGGIYARGDTKIYWSTISNNSAVRGGGLALNGGADGHSAEIVDSTISGNDAIAAGGVRAGLPLQLDNSTIAFNTIPRSYSIPLGYAFSAGLALFYPSTLRSSIVSNNIAHGSEQDDPEDIGGSEYITIDGANNLIMSSARPAPPATITDDPLLEPLHDNDGPTRTHALPAKSPAIDHGGNFLSLVVDQRGAGFARVRGVAPDIGAYERDPDLIFADDFEP